MKSARPEKILELIHEYEIDTQEELVMRLEEAGYRVTQATISRDIHALNLTKVPGSQGKSRYAVLEEKTGRSQDKNEQLLADLVSHTAVGQNMLVLHTAPGMAMGAAAALDSFQWKEILGCIAGDDTIFCVCPNEELAQEIAVRLKALKGAF